MKRSLMSGLLAALMLASSGCAVLRVEADTAKPVLLNNPSRMATAGAFKADGNQLFFLWGLVGNDNKAISDTIVRELGNNRGIVNLKVDKYYSFLDMVIEGITLGIVVPRSYSVTGDLVK